MKFDVECQLWKGPVTTQGYPRRGRRVVPYHRTLYELAFGPIHKGFVVHHLCGDRRCLNLDHLVSCSRGDHMALFHRKQTKERLEANRYRKKTHGAPLVGDQLEAGKAL